MKILFIHQNFPAQFKFLAPALVKEGHEVFALALREETQKWEGITIIPYKPSRSSSKEIHPWVSDFETKVIRGEAAYRKLLELKGKGLEPDAVIAHHGWGETLFIKHVWPTAKVGIYCEFHYSAEGLDVGFDSEFPSDKDASCNMQMKNLNNLVHFSIADAAIAPTQFQASTFPQSFQSKIEVIHDGIDTEALAPDENARLTLAGGLTLDKDSEVISFVNRNFEPYRGYHIFMRALPKILNDRPNAQILLVGGSEVSYGYPPKVGSWKDYFIDEVRSQISDQDWGRVHFFGHLPYEKYLSVLRVSSLHVYLTYPFVLSWSLLEAMSLGVPIVASNTPPVREVIADFKTGRLVNFFDKDELASVVDSLLADEKERNALARKAREFIIENFDLKGVCLPRQVEWVSSLAAIEKF
jgi:glycosyltransferase involved in cell wall biosynthesis